MRNTFRNSDGVNRKRILTTALACISMLCVCHVADAGPGTGVIIAPATVSSDQAAVFGTAAINVVNQSGLSIPYTSGVTEFASYLAMDPTHDGGPEGFVWLFEGSVANFDMDFGADVTVDAIAIWNKDDIFGVADFNLIAADNPDFNNAVNLLTDILSQFPSNPVPTPHEQFSFTSTTARYFRIEILTNHGAFFTGLGELAFSSSGKGGGCDFALGDVNQDGAVNLLDVAPFVDVLTTGIYQCEADVNEDGAVDLLDVQPFVELLGG